MIGTAAAIKGAVATSDLEEIGMQDVSSKGQYIIKYNINIL
mgnify:CR=1 FL=1